MDIVGGHFIEGKKEGRMKGGSEEKRADGEREEREGGRQTR